MVAAYGWGVDGLRVRYAFAAAPAADLPARSSFAYLYDPSGNVAERLELLLNHDPQQTEGLYVEVRDYQNFDAYGALTGRADTISYPQVPRDLDPVGFGGQYGYYTDQETGLVLLGARYYDPSTGRFLNRDPIGYGGGINLYGFCGNNPVNESDPSGDDGQRNHFLMFSSRKQAMEAAQQRSAKGQNPEEHIFDYSHPEAPPHFHAVDPNGNKRSDGVHYGYPRRGGQLPSERLTARANRKLAIKLVGKDAAQELLDRAGPTASKLRIRKLAGEVAENARGIGEHAPLICVLFFLEDFTIRSHDHSFKGFVNSFINTTSPIDRVYTMRDLCPEATVPGT